MTSLIMKDWLLAFYAHIWSQCPVLLLMDKFPAHLGGVELEPPPTNIRSNGYLQTLQAFINHLIKAFSKA